VNVESAGDLLTDRPEIIQQALGFMAMAMEKQIAAQKFA
jgi:hypothetical protein